MFSTLESTWDQSARRGWPAFASFSLQAFGIGLLLLLPLITIQGPPRLQWLQPPILMPPPAPAPPAPAPRPLASSNFHEGQLQHPPTIPRSIEILNEAQIARAPNLDTVGVVGSIGDRGRGVVRFGLGSPIDVVAPPPPAPTPTRPLKISDWAEGNLIYRVQPNYPPLARAARVQGAVELRAIISKTGTIENLVVVRGHPMLAGAALDAVRQWRYRPYRLNNEPIEVETEITVNFLLSGS
jgi:periplasmic protein TonB